MGNKYQRMWELNSQMIGLTSRISRRKQLIEMRAHDSARLAELNAQAERKLELARVEHTYWHQAYILEHQYLLPTSVNGWEHATLDGVVVALRLVALEELALDSLEDPPYVEAARAGLKVYKTALLSMRAILERRLA